LGTTKANSESLTWIEKKVKGAAGYTVLTGNIANKMVCICVVYLLLGAAKVVNDVIMFPV